MSQSQDNQFDLTIRDRINFPFLLAQQVTTFQKAILNTDYSRREIEEAIQGFVNMLPTRWEDEQFKSDIAKAKKTVVVDVRPSFAGVKMKMELAEAKGLPITDKIEVIDYFLLLQACIDLLDRLGMLSKREFTEAPTGMPFGEVALPPGMNMQEYIASLEEEEHEEGTEENGVQS